MLKFENLKSFKLHKINSASQHNLERFLKYFPMIFKYKTCRKQTVKKFEITNNNDCTRLVILMEPLTKLRRLDQK